MFYASALCNFFLSLSSSGADDLPALNEIEEEATVVESIGLSKPGRVLIHGVLWKAKPADSQSGRLIEVGETVRVVGRKGLVLHVSPGEL
ncbi:MAG: NfeD family protein [Cyanobacteria bacterium J06632_3]